MPVNVPGDAYELAAPKWQRCRDCREGSDAVKAAGRVYLPALGSHDDTVSGQAAYNAFKSRALFYNAMARTVQGLSGLIFNKAPTFELTPAIEGHELDVTLADESGEMFSLRACQEVLTTGRFGVLVEMSETDEAPSRPYWVGYTAENIYSVNTERVSAEQVTTRVVLRESVAIEELDDEFAEDEIVQFRVLELRRVGVGESVARGPELTGPEGMGPMIYTQTVWRESENQDGEWIPMETFVPRRRGKPLSFIPFVIIGATTAGSGGEIEKPPLLDLADVNLSHYRGSADLKHGLNKIALPQPWVSGISGTDEGAITIGASVVWMLGEQGRAGYMEYSGAGIGSIREDQKDMEILMATLGARLLENAADAPDETATAVRIKYAGENASIRTIAGALETGLTQVFKWHAWWIGVGNEDPADVEAGIEMNKDFFSQRATPDDVKAAMLLWQAGAISFQSLFYNLKIGEWTRPGVEWEEEQQDLVGEGAAEPEAIPEEVVIEE
jgi:hypothetical protein